MPRYTKGPVRAESVQELALVVDRELDQVAGASEYAEQLILQVLHAAPEAFLPGMIVYADGSDWNPGSGEGVYRRNKANSAWVFLG